MARRTIERLTAEAVRSADVGMHGDGENLYLRVAKAKDGALQRSWIFRYSVSEIVISESGLERQRERQMGLGIADVRTLAAARDSLKLARKLAAKAREARKLGEDPIEAKRAARAALKPKAEVRKPTFDQAADKFLGQHERSWKSDQHRTQWVHSIEKYVSPFIGSKPVDEVTTDDVVAVLERIWPKIPETASRVRGRIEKVLNSAGMNGSNPARWKGHLEHRFPKRDKKETEHHPALPYEQAAEFMTKLRAADSPAAAALEFIVLTAARRSEVLGIPGDLKNRGTTWGEINLDTALWTIPGRRMKPGNEHVVPLSEPALTILPGLERGAEDDRVFDVGPEAVWQLVRRLRPGTSVHGLRSTFRDWAGNMTEHSREVIEEALSHTLSAVEGAYRRRAMLMKRAALMADWARFLARPYAVALAEWEKTLADRERR